MLSTSKIGLKLLLLTENLFKLIAMHWTFIFFLKIIDVVMQSLL